MSKNIIRCIYVQNIKQISWKITEFWYFEVGKFWFFTPFAGISVLSRFSNFIRFGSFRKCPRCILFRFFCEKPTSKRYHTTQEWNFQFDFPWMIRISLGWYLEVSQRRHILFYDLRISIRYDYSARYNQIRRIVKHFDFYLTCDVIGDPEVNNRFPLIRFPDISNTVWILYIGPVGGQKWPPICQSCYGNTSVRRGLNCSQSFLHSDTW